MKKILSALVLIVGGILGLNKVNAEPFLSGINYLKALKIEGTSINFSANTLDYDLVVPYRQEKLVVNYTKGHSKQMVDVLGGPNLYIGVNSIVIRVTAEDKTVRNYNLIIRRQNDGIEVANNQAEILNAMKNNRDSHFYLRLDENEKAIILSKEIVRCLKENNKTFHIDWVDFKGITVRSLEIIGSNITDIDKEINPNLNFEITNKKIVKLIKKQRYFGINAIDTELPSGSVYKHKVSENSSYYLITYNKDKKIQRAQLKLNDGYIILNVDNNEEYAIVTGILNDVIESEINSYSWLYPLLFGIIAALIMGIIGVSMLRHKKFN